jgi:hypothetical protein
LTLTSLVETLLDDLQSLPTETNPRTRANILSRFTFGIFEIGREIERSPSTQQDPSVQRFIEGSATLLAQDPVDIAMIVVRLKGRFGLSFEYDDYALVCQTRSAIAFMDQLYRHTAIEDELNRLDLSAVDSLLKKHGLEQGIASVPEGVPDNHWWWFPHRFTEGDSQ